MARKFNVPSFYKSEIISVVKEARQILDPRKKDLSPVVLDFGPVRFKIARHFGFCYGVENAIEIAYRALEENPNKRIFLISEMIHNPKVNADLKQRGIQFLRTTVGEQLIPFNTLTPDDIVIIPAFGVSIELEKELEKHGVDVHRYDATCPFVVKVWKRSDQIGQGNYTIIVHGKRYHEETRATFSRAQRQAPVLVVRDLEEAKVVAQFITGERAIEKFDAYFQGRTSVGFSPEKDLTRIGVVNQTTMLATETQAIADVIKQAMIERYGSATIAEHFADTRDTLCYATNENQNATRALIGAGADIAIVVGGYNSSNTSHLVELCEAVMPTYFIAGAEEIESKYAIRHFLWDEKAQVTTTDWLPLEKKKPIEILLTAGASCPDSLLDDVLRKILIWFPNTTPIETVMAPFEQAFE